MLLPDDYVGFPPCHILQSFGKGSQLCLIFLPLSFFTSSIFVALQSGIFLCPSIAPSHKLPVFLTTLVSPLTFRNIAVVSPEGGVVGPEGGDSCQIERFLGPQGSTIPWALC